MLIKREAAQTANKLDAFQAAFKDVRNVVLQDSFQFEVQHIIDPQLLDHVIVAGL